MENDHTQLTNDDADSLNELVREFKEFLQRFFLEGADAQAVRQYIENTVSKIDPDIDREGCSRVVAAKPTFHKTECVSMPLSKTANVIFSGKDDLSLPTAVSVGRPGMDQSLVDLQLFVSMPEDGNVRFSHKLFPFDREVYNGICSLLANGQTVFTAKQVYEAFAGKSSRNAQAIEAVEKSIRKMMMTLISINWTEHAKMKGLPIQEHSSDYICQEENMLSLSKIRIVYGGQELNGYQIHKVPALYHYSKSVGQICSVSRDLLSIPGVSNTEDNIVIRNYLLREIEQMKNPRRHYNRTISLNTLFEKCCITFDMHKGNDRKRRLRRIHDILDTMNEWVQSGYIKSYETIERNKSLISIIINL